MTIIIFFMSIVSVWYIFFLLTVVLVYALLGVKARNFWLLLVSYVFLYAGNPRYLWFLIYVTLISWCCGKQFDRCVRKRKALLAISLVLCFVPLFLAKYLSLFAGGLAAFGLQLPTLSMLLPLGLSFYTMEAAAYCIDRYRGRIPAEENLPTYALFLSFFPLITAGPIERAQSILPQLHDKKSISYDDLKNGLFTLLWGFFVKMVIADRLAILANHVFDAYTQYTGVIYLIGTLAFSLQIYCDFSACSLIAIGSARCLGIHVMDNFQTPYFSQSVREFWRRWHISLSTWFRDYLYIPLGGSRVSIPRKYLNLMIVFCLSGLWHGAAITFLIWGAMNGLYQVIEDIMESVFTKRHPATARPANFFIRCLRTGLTFTLISFAWIFFRAENTAQAFQMIRGFLTPHLWLLTDGTLLNLGLDTADWVILCASLLILFLTDLKLKTESFAKKLLAQPLAAHLLVFIFLLCAILIFGIYGPAYNTQNFIYAQF